MSKVCLIESELSSAAFNILLEVGSMEELQMIYYIQMNSVCTDATTVVITMVVPVNKIFIPGRRNDLK